jgi:flagellar M-ring protein FliF
MDVWTALDARRRIIVILATLATAAAVWGLAQYASRPQLSLLYSGLDPASAGEVIAALEESNIPHEVRASGIYVPESDRDLLRMTLAARGLPASGTSGYELLDNLSGFGTTSQMFDAAYWRAKEGELARTILASPGVRSARVHIAVPPKQPFGRPGMVTAAVTVTMSQGTMEQAQAQAIRYLVASAVTGLTAEQVSVMDSAAGVILPPGKPGSFASGPSASEARGAALKQNIERLLEARVGRGRVMAEVMVDADLDSETIVERVIDPDSRVAISSDTEERSESDKGGDAGAVTVASNLPDGDAGAEGGSSSSSASETRERLNFEVSETRRERVIQPGAIQRITVAVLVDGIATVAEDGTRSWEPRSEDELASLKQLVESAIGFDEARGDVVTIQSLEFPGPDGTGTLVEGGLSILDRVLGFVPAAILGVVALLLGLFVVRPILTRPPAQAQAEPALLPGGVVIDAATNTLSGPGQPEAIAGPHDGKVGNLRKVITERYDESSEVLRRWIEAPETQPEQS